MTAILLVGRHHVRPGAHRPLVPGQAVLGHAGLGVEQVRLPGDRRHEGRRHPVRPLRVLALDAHAQQVLVHRLGAFQRPLAEVQEGLVGRALRQALEQLRVLLADQRAVGLQAEHVLGEQAEDRRLDAGGRVALERVDEVRGLELPRALVLELPGRALVAELFRRQVVVAVVALLVLGECRAGRVQDAGADGHVVDALRDLVGGRVLGQAPALRIQVVRLDHRRRDARDQRVGPLQVVVAVERLGDLVGVDRLGRGVGRGRIQVARRALVEGQVEGVVLGRAGRIGTVVARGQQRRGAHRRRHRPRAAQAADRHEPGPRRTPALSRVQRRVPQPRRHRHPSQKQTPHPGDAALPDCCQGRAPRGGRPLPGRIIAAPLARRP